MPAMRQGENVGESQPGSLARRVVWDAEAHTACQGFQLGVVVGLPGVPHLQQRAGGDGTPQEFLQPAGAAMVRGTLEWLRFTYVFTLHRPGLLRCTTDTHHQSQEQRVPAATIQHCHTPQRHRPHRLLRPSPPQRRLRRGGLASRRRHPATLRWPHTCPGVSILKFVIRTGVT
jgi:hypothetical protein